jgi:hypothetical protein
MSEASVSRITIAIRGNFRATKGRGSERRTRLVVTCARRRAARLRPPVVAAARACERTRPRWLLVRATSRARLARSAGRQAGRGSQASATRNSPSLESLPRASRPCRLRPFARSPEPLYRSARSLDESDARYRSLSLSLSLSRLALISVFLFVAVDGVRLLCPFGRALFSPFRCGLCVRLPRSSLHLHDGATRELELEDGFVRVEKRAG